MNNRHFDAIVIGMGAVGSSACYQLAAAGLNVLGLEQFSVPHTLGAFHGDTRMIRMAYYEHADYVPLLRKAYVLWREVETEWAVERVLTITGGLYIGSPESQLIAGSLLSARLNRLPHNQLSHAELVHRYPQFRLPETMVGFYEPEAGYLRSDRAVCMFVELALRHGAEVHGHEPVLSWSSNGGSVQVRTHLGEYAADHLVLAGGAWTSALVRDLGVPLSVTRQVQGWVQPLRPQAFSQDQFCCWAMEAEDGFYYGFPLVDGTPGLKVAEHVRREVVDPDTVDRQPNNTDHERFRCAIRRYLPDADGPLLAMRTCLYTNSPDFSFILDRHPLHERAILACGFSGHGFKFASALGRVVRAFVTGDEPLDGVRFLSLKRFQ